MHHFNNFDRNFNMFFDFIITNEHLVQLSLYLKRRFTFILIAVTLLQYVCLSLSCFPFMFYFNGVLTLLHSDMVETVFVHKLYKVSINHGFLCILQIIELFIMLMLLIICYLP